MTFIARLVKDLPKNHYIHTIFVVDLFFYSEFNENYFLTKLFILVQYLIIFTRNFFTTFYLLLDFDFYFLE